MLIRGATLADGRDRDVQIADGVIVAVESRVDAKADETILDASEYHLLPGAIDAHVHFRVPGDPHKETWHSGSRSAAAGGVTTVVDQPNTAPPTVSGDAFDRKVTLTADSVVDWGINGGVTPDWEPESLFDRELFALGEVFLADSTGEMGVSVEMFVEAVEQAAQRDIPVTVHAEDESLFDESALTGDLGGTGRAAASDRWSAYRTADAEVAAIRQALQVGDHGAGIHIAHTSTPDGIDAVADSEATCEVSPHHMFLSRADHAALGTYSRMNPPLRDESRREAVFQRVADGTVDIVATDHAPHTAAEKTASLDEAPSGVPGVETMLPLLLGAVRREELTLERVRDVTAATPASLFDIPHKGAIEVGRDADLVVVDLGSETEIRASELHTNVEWTPFEGKTGVFPERTLVRGQTVYDRDEPTGSEFGPSIGQNVRNA
ncbi:MAG: dihydroorotase [Halorubrum sp. J07HR59]|nr:MAG: dihydroorotase [Halorubrum sp. J07HR59]